MSTSTSDTPAPGSRRREAFQNDLLSWYDRHKRELPWRNTDDPYRIWVSEVMLQQTRVDQAIPYYRRFLEAFPSVDALADASRDEVLQEWEGLGYYSRARYLHEAARTVVREHNSNLPETEEEIRKLPGIGPYTAAAVLSIAFEKPYAVVDGNVSRVLSRVFALEDDITRYATKRVLRELADELLAEDKPAAYNQALMELGATICTPQNPLCTRCPLQEVCKAYAATNPTAYPVKSSRKDRPHHNIAVGLVLNEQDQLLITKRPEDAMLGGLWEFPGGKQEDQEPLHETCARELREELGIHVRVGPQYHELNHGYSHFTITLHAFPCRIEDGTPEPTNGMPMAWATLDELSDYAFPRANRQIIEKLQNQNLHPDLFEQASRKVEHR